MTIVLEPHYLQCLGRQPLAKNNCVSCTFGFIHLRMWELETSALLILIFDTWRYQSVSCFFVVAGFVYYSQLVQNVPPDLRRKVSRIVGMRNSKISTSIAGPDLDPHGSALILLPRNRIRIGNVKPDPEVGKWLNLTNKRHFQPFKRLLSLRNYFLL